MPRTSVTSIPRTVLTLTLAAGLLAGCRGGPDHRRPGPERDDHHPAGPDHELTVRMDHMERAVHEIHEMLRRREGGPGAGGAHRGPQGPGQVMGPRGVRVQFAEPQVRVLHARADVEAHDRIRDAMREVAEVSTELARMIDEMGGAEGDDAMKMRMHAEEVSRRLRERLHDMLRHMEEMEKGAGRIRVEVEQHGGPMGEEMEARMRQVHEELQARERRIRELEMELEEVRRQNER